MATRAKTRKTNLKTTLPFEPLELQTNIFLMPSIKIAQFQSMKNFVARAKNRFVFKHHLLTSQNIGEWSRAQVPQYSASYLFIALVVCQDHQPDFLFIFNASWEILHVFFCRLLIFSKSTFFKSSFRKSSECQTVWIQIKPDILSGLI